MTRKDGRVTTAPGQEDGDFMVTAEFGLHMAGGGHGRVLGKSNKIRSGLHPRQIPLLQHRG